MIRRSFLCCVVMLVPGCVQEPLSAADTETPSDSVDGTLSEPIADMDFTTNPADPPVPTDGPTMTMESHNRQLSIQATVRIPNSCHELRLDTITTTTDTISVSVSSTDTSQNTVNCSSQIAYASYLLNIRFSESLSDFPEKARVQHPIDETTYEFD